MLEKELVFEDDLNDQLRGEPRQELTPLMIAAGLRAAASEIPFKTNLVIQGITSAFIAKSPFKIIRQLTRGPLLTDRQGLLKLANALSSGSSFDGAIANVRGLPEDLREIVSAGVKTGQLPRLLEEYLETNRQSRSLWRGFYLGVLYPVLILFLSFIIMTCFVLIVVPQFKAIFEDFGVELPGVTMVMISLSDILLVVWLPMMFVVLVLLIFFQITKYLPIARFRAKLFHMLPWVGTAQKMAASAEFCSRLAVLIECRLPLGEALRIVSQTMRDPYFCHIAHKIANRVESGAVPEDLFVNISGVPSALENSFRWSRTPETFADGLRSLAIVFGSQARLSTGQFVVITEPFAVIGVALLAGMIVIAMFAPLIKLLNDLS